MTSSSTRPSSAGRAAQSGGKSASGRVEALAYTLRDTNQNLRAVEKMLHDLGTASRMVSPQRSRVQSGGRHDDSPGRRVRRGTVSDRDEYSSRGGRGYQPDDDLSVRFFDDMDAGRGVGDVHKLHQSLRDLSSGQHRLSEELEREKERMRLLEAETRAKHAEEEALEKFDRRLQRIDDDFKTERSQLKSKQEEVAKVSAELKQALERQRVRELEEERERVRRELSSKRETSSSLLNPPGAENAYLRQQLEQQAEQLREYLRKATEQQQTEREIQNLKLQMTNLLGANDDGGRRRRDSSHDGGRTSAIDKERIDGYAREILSLQKQVEASTVRSEELKSQAQETIKLWKGKNQKLSKDVLKQRSRADQADRRIDELNKEIDSNRSRLTAVQQQFDRLLREFNDLMATRVELDERLTERDGQINRLTSFVKDLENDIGDRRVVMETLEKELRGSQHTAYTAVEECNRLREESKAFESAATSSAQLARRLQQELNESISSKAELSTRLSRANAETQELQSTLDNLRRSHAIALEQNAELQVQLRENKDSVRLAETLRLFKKERAESSADIVALKLALEEEKSVNKLAKRQQASLQEELERTCQDLAVARDEMTATEQRYCALRQELVVNTFETEDGINRTKELQLELIDAKESLARLGRNHDNDLDTLSADIDSVMRSLVDGTNFNFTMEPRPYISANIESPSKAGSDRLAKTRLKINRLKQELLRWQAASLSAAEKEAKNRLASATDTKDCQFLLTAIDRQKEALDRMTFDKISEREVDKLTTERLMERELERLRSEKLMEQELDRLADEQKREKVAAVRSARTGGRRKDDRRIDKSVPLRSTSRKSILKPSGTPNGKKDDGTVITITVDEEQMEEDGSTQVDRSRLNDCKQDEINARYEKLKESVVALREDVSNVRLFKEHPDPVGRKWNGEEHRADRSDEASRDSVLNVVDDIDE